MPQIQHIYESCLCASDLDAAVRFYEGILGFRCISSMGTRGRVFRITATQVLIVFNPRETVKPDERVPSHGTTGEGHVAFSIQPADYEPWLNHLIQHGMGIETEVTWPTGAKSMYFRDPAGNSVELVAGNLWPA